MKNLQTWLFAAFAAVQAGMCALADNPFLPLWEFIPDGEPYVFDDPDNPGKQRVYLYGSHDVLRDRYCGRDQVVWSAPVEDLNNWRFDGVIFRSIYDAKGRRLEKDGVGDILYAPDIAVRTTKKGRKIYYLYPNNQAKGRETMVAWSLRPDGPFKVCNWDPDDPKKTVGCFGFDPAVFVDDDGRVYGYWGFERSFAAEIDPKTMASVKSGTEIVQDMVSNRRSRLPFGFFEASSIRKIKDKYVFIYSRWTANGEFGLWGSNYTLGYAYSDKPLGPWTYGGTIIDARGRETLPDGRTIATATPTGNTHGSICEINGQWYVFYHRQCGLDEFSRQAMVAPITVEVEEGPGGKVKISEAEHTSEGFATLGLDPFAHHQAGIACVFTGPKPAVLRYPDIIYYGPYPKPHYVDAYGQKPNPYDLRVNRCNLAHCTDGSTAGYKYFNFDKTHGRDGLKLLMYLIPQGVDATVTIWVGRPNSEEGGVKIGSFELSSSMGDTSREIVVDVPGLSRIEGRKALYFTFSADVKDQSICELEGFRFTAK